MVATKAQLVLQAKEESQVGKADHAYLDSSKDRYGDLYLIWNQLHKFTVIDIKGNRKALDVAA